MKGCCIQLHSGQDSVKVESEELCQRLWRNQGNLSQFAHFCRCLDKIVDDDESSVLGAHFPEAMHIVLIWCVIMLLKMLWSRIS